MRLHVGPIVGRIEPNWIDGSEESPRFWVCSYCCLRILPAALPPPTLPTPPPSSEGATRPSPRGRFRDTQWEEKLENSWDKYRKDPGNASASLNVFIGLCLMEPRQCQRTIMTEKNRRFTLFPLGNFVGRGGSSSKQKKEIVQFELFPILQ